MSNLRFLGLESIKLGVVDLADAGTNYMPATFTTISNIVPDSAHFVVEMPDETRLFVEQSATPDITVASGDHAMFIEFATRDMDLDDTFVQAFGGSVSTTGNTYSFPSTLNVLREKAVQAISEAVEGTKFKILIPRASSRGQADLRMRKRNPDTGEVGFNLTALQAITNAGTVVAPIKIVKV